MDAELNPALIIFAAVLPLIIAVVKQSGFTTQVNALIAFAAYIIVGVAGALASGVAVTPETLVEFVATVTTIGTVAYNLLWSNLGKTETTGTGLTPPLSIDQKITEVTSIIKPDASGW